MRATTTIMFASAVASAAALPQPAAAASDDASGVHKGYFKIQNFVADHETNGILGAVSFNVSAPSEGYGSTYCTCSADSGSNYHGLASCNGECTANTGAWSFDFTNQVEGKNGNPRLMVQLFLGNSTRTYGTHVFPKKQIKTYQYPAGMQGEPYQYQVLYGRNDGNFAIDAKFQDSV